MDFFRSMVLYEKCINKFNEIGVYSLMKAHSYMYKTLKLNLMKNEYTLNNIKYLRHFCSSYIRNPYTVSVLCPLKELF